MDDIKKQIRDAIQMDYVVPEDIPDIELYMDQVTTFMEQHMQHNKRSPEDKILTKTMINNYTKNHLLPPPEKKKYTKDHIILMLYTYYLKNFLSIGDIQTLLTPMIDSYYGMPASSETSLTNIYEMVVDLAKHQYQYDKKNIFETYELVHQKLTDDKLQEVSVSNTAASDTPDDPSDEYLHDFLFVAMLSYDIYLKTQLVEKIIGDMAPLAESINEKEEKKQKVQKSSITESAKKPRTSGKPSTDNRINKQKSKEHNHHSKK
ncbi:MAG: DUF1836 domain-containing protein [Lachnospiraceae bacterium]|nr:DUF1836 domain-containing protein [Lachnospiraceae bacterium]